MRQFAKDGDAHALFDALGMKVMPPEMRAPLECNLRKKAERLLGIMPEIRIVPGSTRMGADLVQLATDAGGDLLALGSP